MVFKRFLLCLGAAALWPDVVEAQTPTTSSTPRVYLDCSSNCFEDYLRTELLWIDFVRQREDADVHVITVTNETGGGGQETVVRLIGVGRWSGVQQELRAVTAPAESEDTRRRRLLDTLAVGVLGFLARGGLPQDLEIDVDSQQSTVGRTVAADPWNAWVFRVGADMDVEAETSNKLWNWQLDTTADRVTDQWKISFGLTLEQEKETFDLDEDEPFSAHRSEEQGNWFIAKSLGEHWSFGIDGDLESSTFSNVKFRAGVAPAIEFNLFPYTQYATRQLRMEYSIGPEHTKYNEVTIYDQTEETRGRHEVSVTLDQRQPWGTLLAGVEWSQYLHDLTKQRLEFEGEVSVSLARGLSVDFQGSASRIRDQLSLPKRGASDEEILLRLRELQSDYEVNFSVGVSYSFGSIFNSVVNPRFGR